MPRRSSHESGSAFAPWRLALALALYVALQAPAYGEAATIIACQGILTTNSSGTSDLTDYYKINQSAIQLWDDGKSAWQEDMCTRNAYSCSINEKRFCVEGAFVGDGKQHVKHTISIDRVTGKIEESWIVKKGESMYFEGDCKKSRRSRADHHAPTKF